MTTRLVEIAGAGALHRIAEQLGRRAQAGDVLGLIGGLGAGKTVFARGFAEGLGVPPEAVSSPTFTLIQEYRGGRVLLHHVDLYRLENVNDLAQIGLDELYREATSVVAVEWFDRFPAPGLDVLVVDIEITGSSSRRLRIEPRGERAEAWATGWPART